MRRPIDTAPRDGQDIWVESATGAFDIAHWSREAGEWVWKNGHPIRIAPTHWYPITEDVFQEDESSGRLQVGRAGQWLAGSLIAAILVAAALIGVFDQSSGPEVSKTIEAGRAVGLDLKPEVAGWQTLVQRGTTAVLMQDTDLSRQMLLADTVQRRQALDEETSHRDAPAAATSAELQQSLYQEREKSAALTAELAKVRGDLETMLALSSKFQDDAIQRWEAAEIAAEELRQSLQQEQAHAAALANELAGTRRETETRDIQSRNPDDATAQQRQTTEREIAELRQSLQQEQEKTAALTQEVGAARQAMTASAEQQRRALDEAQMRAAALASELAGTSSEIETQAAQSQKAVDEAVQQKQTAEATIAELRQSLQQERSRTEAMARDLASARRPVDERVTVGRAIEGPMMPVTQTVAAAVSEPPTAADQDKAEAARLIARASALLGQGNIGAARIVLERAAENDNARASFMLAETYDPAVLSAWGTYGTRGEAAKARELYAKAHSGGIREAKDRLDALPR
ncbi:hypothetical protein OZ411_06020 [Bradyrhizobium sp. Arg237L]|uniref:hypothetical protein n=1 Tax=Bradyrhizobium sp. Arg237L TaxID=3003352 RepID=UPI00249DC38A|nr:hypothetical protein [Bradyrhizobium sp. Arg237L]MDI4232372.1 hypothetical protein [Bradyrhizobium sp. Arg237L]